LVKSEGKLWKYASFLDEAACLKHSERCPNLFLCPSYGLGKMRKLKLMTKHGCSLQKHLFRTSKGVKAGRNDRLYRWRKCVG
jgi:hypothetical protein